MNERPTKVSELLKKPENWTKGTYARNDQGLSVDWTHPGARCWCLTGAIALVYGDNYGSDPNAPTPSSVNQWVRAYLREKGLGWRIPVYNDATERTFEEVRQLVLELDI